MRQHVPAPPTPRWCILLQLTISESMEESLRNNTCTSVRLLVHVLHTAVTLRVLFASIL